MLEDYRAFRRKCLEYLHGVAPTSVSNQIHSLTWHTMVFRTLNEARRLEPRRTVNGALWELTSVGYAHIISLGIRKLVDRDSRTDSLWNVIAQLERRPELLRRECYVCYDAIPYDYAAAETKHYASVDMSKGFHVGWVAAKGPEAWGTSQRLHEAFDALAGYPAKRKRMDVVQPSIIAKLKANLSHPTVEKVLLLTDRIIAHAERIATGSETLELPTYDDINEALKILVRITNFISSTLFYDAAFGSVVPVPQFNVFEGLDQPWVTTEKLPALQTYWDELSETIDRWAYDTDEGFLPPKSPHVAPH